MARKNKNTVTLTFAGDASQLNKAFDKVGSSAREMSGEVGSASREMSNAGEGFDKARERTDALDTAAMGFRDTMTGVQDTMRGAGEIARGNLFEGFFNLGMGIGDLASGFTNFLIPAIKNASLGMVRNAVTTTRATAASVAHRVATVATTGATKAMTVAQRVLNAAMRANPLLLIVSLLATLVGAIVVAYQKSETFRRIVQGAMSGVRRAFQFVLNKGRDLLGWFRDLPGKVGRFLSGIGRAVSAPFRAAFRGVRNLWNSTVGGFGFSVPGWVPIVGGNQFRIPFMHQGGRVPGSPGQEVLTMLEAGEHVTPAGASGGRTVIEIRSGGSTLDDALVEILSRAVRVRGGDVQLVLGGGG